ncbi:MAG TPA: phosphodiester glycosidase family protein [Ignavibacteriales bacterium]|nr:phosphodiester glycosidase family protein [Ignavibacteriales bacterium]
MKGTLTALMLLVSILQAQTITWKEVTSSYSTIPGVTVYSGTKASVPSFYAFYIDVDMNNPNVAIRPYLTSSPSAMPEFLKKTGAYAAINGGFFGGTTAYSAVVYPSEVKAQNVPTVTRNGAAYPLLRSFFGIKSDRSMAVDWIYNFGPLVSDIYKFTEPLPYIYNDPTPKSAPSKTSGTQYLNLLAGIGGGPTLVKNGAEKLTYNEEVMWGSGVDLSAEQYRTAIGYTPDKHAILFCSSPLPLSELPSIFISLGCTEAMNLDGGGSTQMSIGSQNLISSSRALPVILAIVNPDSMGLPKIPVYQKVIDTGDKDARLSGGWFASANTGYYGSTPAMLCGAGDGSAACTFRLNPPASAVYEVYGWWTASSNRAKEAPFIIKHKNGTDTVYADQTSNGSAWTLIGKYTFKGDSTDQVILTNRAKSGTYVVADAIRVISFDPTTGVNEEAASESRHLPENYELMQNYPNPFNPNTTIKYWLPKESKVKITVYNCIGKLVSVLDNSVQSAGYHDQNFNAGNISSGIYFYKIEAIATDGSKDFREIKKMLLLK